MFCWIWNDDHRLPLIVLSFDPLSLLHHHRQVGDVVKALWPFIFASGILLFV